MNDCPRFGKWFGGCHFKPRYDRPAERFATELHFVEMMSAEQIKAAQPQPTVYVRDVCVRCGKTIERQKP